MDWAERLAEQRILEAQREGVFDDLEGKGKPLPPDPFARLPGDIRLAMRVLAMAGHAPQEVGLLRELNEARRRLRVAGTADEKARWLREYCYAELKYNMAMDRHRRVFGGTPVFGSASQRVSRRTHSPRTGRGW